MKFVDKIKKLLIKEENKKVKIEDSVEEYEVIINDIDCCALYFKNRDKKYVFIKDENFPFMLNNPDLEFIEDNKDNFEYYLEFDRLEMMNYKILEIEREENINKKTENDYLVDYIEHIKNGAYSKIIDNMKCFKIDNLQYNELLNEIKNQTQKTIENLANHYIDTNPQLNTNRTYKEIMDNLMNLEDFVKKYPYKYFEEFRYGKDSVSHCGYPDYMWQSGAERKLYSFIQNTQ